LHCAMFVLVTSLCLAFSADDIEFENLTLF